MMLFWPQLCHDFKIKSLRKTEREKERGGGRERDRIFATYTIIYINQDRDKNYVSNCLKHA